MYELPTALDVPQGEDVKRRSLDRAVLESVRPLSGSLAIAAACYGVFNGLALEVGKAPILAFNAALVTVFTVLWWLLRRRGDRMDPRWANPLVTAILLFCLANVLFKTVLLGEAVQSKIAFLIVLVGGCLLLSARWLAVLIGTTLVSWVAVASSVLATRDLIFSITNLLAASVVAVAIHIARLRTQRRLHQALASASQSREYYRRLLSQSKDCVTISTPEGRLVDINPAGIETFGAASKEEMLALDLGRDVYTDTGEREELLRELEEKGFVQDFQTRLRTLDGRLLDIEGTTSALRDEGGRFVALLSILRDITDRKRAEEALKQHRDALEQRVQESLAEKALLHRITVAANEAPSPRVALEAGLHEVCVFARWPVGHVYEQVADGPGLGPTGMWFLEEPERFAEFRRATEQTFLAPGEGLPGRVLTSGEPAWVADLPRVAKLARSGPARDAGIQASFGFPVMVGSEVTAVLEFFALEPSEPGRELLEVMAQVGVQLGRVIERQRAQEQRRQLEEQIQHAQKLESLGVLAGGIAHDLNNRLSAILGHAELAQEELPRRSPVHAHLRKISEEGDRAATLADQMLSYSGRGRFVVEPIDLRELAREMTGLLKGSIPEEARLEMALAESLPRMEGDAGQIRQVVLNLVTNAAESLENGRGRVRVRVGRVDLTAAELDEAYPRMERSEGRYLTLEVSDTGRGMSLEVREKVFDPFFTTKLMGRGLGMAAVLGIIRGHRGSITILSETAGESSASGSTVTVLFPALEESAATAES